MRPKTARSSKVILTGEEQSNQPANAFEVAFRQNWSRVCGLLARLVGDDDEAEDLALEVFWRLYRRDLAESDQPVGGWLYRVATNLGYNALRDRQRRKRYEEEAARQDLYNHSQPSPAGAAETALERETVRKVLSQMKPRHAQILMLRHSGLSYTEIAEALEISKGSVGTLLARAEAEFEKGYRHLEGR
jgi:RNA polymerase sigma-70 factor (ECF subfamily)